MTSRCKEHGLLHDLSVRFFRNFAAAAVLAAFLLASFAVPRLRAATAPPQTEKSKPNESKQPGDRRAPQSADKAGGVAAKPTEVNSVVLSGHLSQAESETEHAVRFWLTIENRSPVPLTNVTLDQLDAGPFRVIRRCWSAELQDRVADDACNNAQTSPSVTACAGTKDVLCANVPANSAIAAWGDLTADDDSDGTREAFAVVRWTQAGALFQSRAAVDLGSIESVTGMHYWWRAITGVSLSALLAILAACWTLYRYRKDHRDAEMKRVLDQKRETWNLLLTRMQDFSLKYYMPIVSDLQGVTLYLSRLHKVREQIEAEKDPARKAAKEQEKANECEEFLSSAFAFALRAEWRTHDMRTCGATWYLKSLTAETLVVALVQAHRKQLGLETVTGRASVQLFLNDIDENTPVSDTIDAVKVCEGDQKAQFESFKRWAVTSEGRREITRLGVIAKIVYFEVNRQLLYWYGTVPPIGLADPKKSGSLRHPNVKEQAATHENPAAKIDDVDELEIIYQDVGGDKAAFEKELTIYLLEAEKEVATGSQSWTTKGVSWLKKQMDNINGETDTKLD